MCEFISWIEYEDQILFLTDADLNTKRGRELRDYLGKKFDEDIMGHGAIRFYYEIGQKGHNRECTNFLNPDNFPAVIQNAIKKGKFSKIGIPEVVNQVLTKSAKKEYDAVKRPAKEEYDAVKRPAKEKYDAIVKSAWEKYEAVRNNKFWEQYDAVRGSAKEQYAAGRKPAWEEYDAIVRPAWEEYEAIVKSAWEQYEAVRESAKEQYDAVKRPAKEEYDAVKRPAKEKYDAVRNNKFWELVRNPENRVKVWV